MGSEYDPRPGIHRTLDPLAGYQAVVENNTHCRERTWTVMQSSSASDFIEHLRRAASSVGCVVSGGDAPCIEQCGPAELSLLLTDLHEVGYSIVSSRPEGGCVQLGIMKWTRSIPEFFSVRLAQASVNLPKTDGLFLAFLGPDGVGKTTTASLVMENLKPIFADQ